MVQTCVTNDTTLPAPALASEQTVTTLELLIYVPAYVFTGHPPVASVGPSKTNPVPNVCETGSVKFANVSISTGKLTVCSVDTTFEYKFTLVVPVPIMVRSLVANTTLEAVPENAQPEGRVERPPNGW